MLFVFAVTVENRIVEEEFSIHGLPDANGVFQLCPKRCIYVSYNARKEVALRQN